MPEKKTHIYRVTTPPDKGVQLIRATSKASVRGHLTRMFEIELASHEDIVELYGQGQKVIDAAENGASE